MNPDVEQIHASATAVGELLDATTAERDDLTERCADLSTVNLQLVDLLAAANAARAPVTLVEQNLAALPLSSPISPADWRKAFGLSTGPGTSALTHTHVALDQLGNKGIVTRIPKGTIGGGGSGQVTPFPIPVVDEAWLRYDVTFLPGFDVSLGGKLPGLSGVAPGLSPTLPTGGTYAGDLGWSCRFMWLSPGVGGPKPGSLLAYPYHPTQVHTGSGTAYGDNIFLDGRTKTADASSKANTRALVVGKTMRLVQHVRMNTIGQADGLLEVTLDGERVLACDDFVWRTRPDVGISHVQYAVFRGGAEQKWAGAVDSSVHIKNLRVTDR